VIFRLKIHFFVCLSNMLLVLFISGQAQLSDKVAFATFYG